eukprot:CAMPEP_0119319050 /NCGR_PEP_ID=MMETSP1333-20130426/48346_1 /TAXON_ID=418940 /ORGANISM="Scyphosphaera apsteinii, Strain RCC1455" /LENGTH=225 /DNA_ID=CAMNT_0007325373 /DNA_START=647 /DNA_END=1321 /DNA_ORIENTATION=-
MDPAVLRVALLRHPLDRAESAFFSKVSCEAFGDANDHVRIIRKLIQQAPTAAASLGPTSRRPPADNTLDMRLPDFIKPSQVAAYTENDNGRNTTSIRNMPCLSAEDWGRMVAEAKQRGELQNIDVHFMPQTDSCGLRELGYHWLIPLHDNVNGMQQLASHLGVQRRAHLSRSHMVQKRPRGHALGLKAEALIHQIYRDDFTLLRFAPEVPKPARVAINESHARTW